MRIVADRELCVGSGNCVLNAPELFDQDEDDGRVVLRVERPDPDATGGAHSAVNLCPARALSLVED